MRTNKEIAQAIATQVVNEAHRLVKSDLPTQKKIAEFKALALEQGDRVLALNEQIESPLVDDDRRAELKEIAQIRARARDYLKAHVAYLQETSNQSLAVRERPQMFAVPDWTVRPLSELVPDSPEYPFMEYSS